MKETSNFLKSRIKEFNDIFALPLNKTKSIFEKQPDNTKVYQSSAVQTRHKIDNGHCIRYKNKYYLPVTVNRIKIY